MVRRTPAQLEVVADSESACSRERGRIRRADCLCAISWMRSGRVFVVRGFAQCGDYGEAGEGHVDCRKFWGRKFWGQTPKTLGFLVILGLQSGFAAVAALKRRGGCGAATFRWCGYDWRDSLYLGLVSAEAKAVHSVHLWYVVSAGPSKTSERAQPDPKPPLTTTPLIPHSLFEIEHSVRLERAQCNRLEGTV